MKLRQVEGIPNFFVNEDSGIHYVRKMVNGRVVWKSTGLTNRKQAFRRYNELMTLLHEKKAGWEPKVTPTLDEWWATYRKAKTKTPRTWDVQENIMNSQWLPQLGKLELSDIKPSHIERILAWRRRKVSPGTLRHEQAVLQAVFQAAVDDDILLKSPLAKLPLLRMPIRTQVLSEEDQQKVLAIASAEVGRWLQFVLGTGLRFTEVQQLTESNIDWTAPTVTVVGKGNRRRTVPLLSPILVEILQQQLAIGKLWPQTHSYWLKTLHRLAKDAGVPRFSPHILRHSFATRYLQSGGDIYILSQILGHASVTMTERVYAHLLHQDHARLSQHVNLRLLPVAETGRDRQTLDEPNTRGARKASGGLA